MIASSAKVSASCFLKFFFVLCTLWNQMFENTFDIVHREFYRTVGALMNPI
jgi:hypothetical protein